MAIPSPDGYLTHGLISWGLALSPNTYVAKGAEIKLPDLRSASVGWLNRFHEQTGNFLASIGEEWTAQVFWTVDNDYAEPLERYHAQTEKLADEGALSRWAEFTRRERYGRYVDAMLRGKLRRERLFVFIAKRMSNVPKKVKTEQVDELYAQAAQSFDHKLNDLANAVDEVEVNPLGDEEHAIIFRRFFNPSLAGVSLSGDNFEYVPQETILDNCWYSDAVTFKVEDQGYCFKMDDHYHSVIVLKRWPAMTYPGIMNALTGCLSLDYCITQTIFPLKLAGEIKKAEGEIARLSGDLQHQGKASAAKVIERKQNKVHKLMGGYARPFNVATVIRIWDTTIRGLSSKALAVKTAIQSMNGAQYHQVNHPVEAQRLFYESFPGWTGGKLRGWDLYAESDFMGDMLPMSSTFTGELADAEAIYEGNQNNLIGVRTFAGKPASPQHGIMFGMSGAGKSVAMIDLLTQTEGHYGYTAIIEEGLSYGIYTRMMGGEPIVVQPNSRFTINYFDTEGNMLTPEHLSMCTALLMRMSGGGAGGDTAVIRESMIGEYLHSLYSDAFEDWRTRNETTYLRVCRIATLMDRTLERRNRPSETLMDVHNEFREIERAKPAKFEEMLAEIGEDEAIAFSKDLHKSQQVMNLAFAYFERTDFPTHSALVETMTFGPLDHHKEEEVSFLASMLSAWKAHGGKYGQLFDGYTNIDLTGRKITHFELGYIPESAKELKAAAGFLISNQIRQHVLRMPRGIRKRLIFEEVSRFLDVPGGDKILAESYAQLRKFGAWVIIVTQQYAQLKGMPLLPVIVGNSKMALLLKQKDAEDVEDFGNRLGLSEVSRKALMSYPLPEHQKGAKFSSFLAVSDSGSGTGRIYARPEMLWVASSNGDDFEKRVKLLERYDDPLEAVVVESTTDEAAKTEIRSLKEEMELV
jgi:hypothetical protein